MQIIHLFNEDNDLGGVLRIIVTIILFLEIIYKQEHHPD